MPVQLADLERVADERVRRLQADDVSVAADAAGKMACRYRNVLGRASPSRAAEVAGFRVAARARISFSEGGRVRGEGLGLC